MALLIRRTNLLVPVTAAGMQGEPWRHGADAITLDPVDAAARARLREAIVPAGRGAAEIFVRARISSLRNDLDAAVWPGLRGIVLCGVAAAPEAVEAAAIVAELEVSRGLAAGSVEFILLLESARAVWDVRAILAAGARVTQAGLDERALAADLGIADVMLPEPEHDPFVYARGRLAFEATAAKVQALGMIWPLSVRPGPALAEEIHAAATKARNSGMKGVLCADPGWIAPVNAAFTPTAELVAWNRRVREAFAAGVAAGTAAVPLEGKMIDVPVDEWAIVVLAMSEACAARDAEKAAALAR
jgi:citrate lyase subunit beta/citryl-CoA lyase